MNAATIGKATFLVFLVGVSILFIFVVRPFLLPIFWATVLGILFYPLYRRLFVAMPRMPSIAALLTLVTLVVVVIVPIFFVGEMVVSESFELYAEAQGINTGTLTSRLNDTLAGLERFGLDGREIIQKGENLLHAFGSWFGGEVISIGQGTLRFAVSLVVTLYLFFFILRDGNRLMETTVRILPLGDKRERHLLGMFASITRATLKGTFVIGVAQGVIGGLLFWLAGAPSPFLWGLVMTVLSILPAVGAGLVWFPASVILFLVGNVSGALIVFLGGVLLVSTVDNFLRPVLIGRDIKMPDPLILVSTLGGLSFFGISGFILGPVVAGFFLAMWKMFEEEYAQ